VDLGGRGQPVLARQVDVDDGHFREVAADGADDVVAGRHLGDHLDVGLQIEQRDESPPYHVHVLGKQDPDSHGYVRLLLLPDLSGAPQSIIHQAF
jgi:hypothetical protein